MGSNPKYIKSPGDYNKYTDYTFSDFWNKHKKDYPFDGAKAKEIMRRFANLVHEEVLNNPDGFKLPASVGTLLITGCKGYPKDKQWATKDKHVEHRNTKTNQVVYSCDYIFGKNRGRCYSSLLWKFKSTVPLRQKIKQRIDEDEYSHWYILRNKKDLPRYDISPDIPVKHYKDSDKKRSSKQIKKLDKGS